MKSRDTVPWKVRHYADTEQVLTAADLDALSATHDLDRESLDPLVHQLTIRLDDSRRFRRGDLDTLQQQCGLQEIDAAVADLAAGARKLERALRRLEGLRIEHPFAHTGMPNPANAQRAALSDALASARATQDWLELLRKVGGVMSRDPADKRKLRDERRGVICSAIFDVWIDAGRSVTYTTNPLSNAREGPLVRFVNDVVRHLTDPPTALSGDAIKFEIEAYRSARPDVAPLASPRQIDTEAERLLEGVEAAAIGPSTRFVMLLTMVRAHQRQGTSAQRETDIRLALRLAEALQGMATSPAERATALAASATAKAALAQMVWDLDALEAAAADLRQALDLTEAEGSEASRTEILLSHAGALAALDTLNDRIPSDAAIHAYTKALHALESGDDALRRAYVRTIIAVGLARRGTRSNLATAEGHLRQALADLQGQGAPGLITDIAHNLALVLSRKAALALRRAKGEGADTKADASANNPVRAGPSDQELHLRARFAQLDKVPNPEDRAAILLNLARHLFDQSRVSDDTRPLDEAADLASLAYIISHQTNDPTAQDQANKLMTDIQDKRAETARAERGGWREDT